MPHHRFGPRIPPALILLALTGLALAPAAEAQSQAGGLPDVSSRVQVLEIQTRALETRLQTVQNEAAGLQTQVQTLQGQVNTLQSANAALVEQMTKEEQTRQAADAKFVEQMTKEEQTRQAADAKFVEQMTKEEQTRQAADARFVEQMTKEEQTRQAADDRFQEQILKEQEARLTADSDLRAKLDVFSDPAIMTAQFEIAGPGGHATNGFGGVLSEIVGPGSWIPIATISNLHGDTLNGSPASRACELRNAAGAFLGGATASNHDADGVALVITAGVFVESGHGQEIVLWCRVTNSVGGAAWDGAQIVTVKIAGFRED